MNRHALFAASLLATVAFQPALAAEKEAFTVIIGGRNVGHVKAETEGRRTTIDYDFKNNGRGPTMKEALEVDAGGLPTSWTIQGTTTFGSKVEESFALKDGKAEWTDSTGSASAAVKGPSLYVGQNASPWALGLYARALLKDADRQLPALPGGTAQLAKGESLKVAGKGGPVQVTTYTLSGLDLNPSYFLLDAQRRLFALITPNFVVVRAGYEGEQERLRGIAERLSTQRYADIQKATAHTYGAPVRIRNVRLFDAKKAALTGPQSVVVFGNRIASVEAADAPATKGEVEVDGGGGTLVPGLYEMHGHISQNAALLNIAAGVTTVRDMGNDNAVLQGLVERIESGKIAGPRVYKSGFIEGKSPFNSNNGILVESEQQAVEAVRWYAARGFPAIKVYNSIDPKWVSPMAQEAHRLGMHVMGHVPAFTNADAVVAAGYDELTHINQLMLGWVLEPGEDTRTLLRLTALKRLPALDLDSERVQKTVRAMVERKVAIDPTIVIHEALTQNRHGQVPPGMADYLEHMPVSSQRDAKQAWVDAAAPADDQAYRAAFEKILEALKMLHARGVLLVPGTDMGGAFNLHRELELFQRLGMTPAQVLKRATYDMAAYLKQEQQLGSIEKGKLADFFLVPGDPTKDLKAVKTPSMVVKDGTVYFPSEIYGHFGIKPFAPAPKVVVPAT
jgi:imidazolonepropionase-like amidohydrolase